jgi:surface protein
MFYGASEFNSNVTGWDTGRVTIMDKMFYRASAFNSDVNGWDIGRVTSMKQTFFNFTVVIAASGGRHTSSDASVYLNLGNRADADSIPVLTGTAYRIAPLKFDLSEDGTTFSFGGMDDVTFRLDAAEKGELRTSNATEDELKNWFINVKTGEITGLFSKSGNYSFKLTAIDQSLAEGTVETYEFVVQDPLDFCIELGNHKTDAKYVALADGWETGTATAITAGRSIRLAPPTLAEGTTYSQGGREDVTFSLEIVPEDTTQSPPDGLALKPSGEVIGTFTEENVGRHTIKVVARDAGGNIGTICNAGGASTDGATPWQYAVEVPEIKPFSMSKTWAPDTVVVQTTSYDHLPNPVYQFGETYAIPSPGLKSPEPNSIFVNPAGNNFEAITFITLCRKGDDAAFSGDLCPGKFFVAENGEILAQMKAYESKDAGVHFTAKLVARDSAGKEAVVKHWEFEVRQTDTDIPNANNTCGEHGDAVDDDTKYDGSFICKCSDEYTGDRCDTEPVGSSASKSSGVVIGAICAAFVALFFVGIATFRWSVRRAQMKAFDFQNEINRMLASGERDFVGEYQGAGGGAGRRDDESPAPSSGNQVHMLGIPREIKRSHLHMLEEVGKGQFGSVYKATLDESSVAGGVPEYLVAAKTVLDANASPDATRELRVEAMMMARLGAHPHVVSIVGVITRGDPLVLIVSFCEHGSLLSLLRSRAAAGQPLTAAAKIKMACDVAKGMAHLETHQFVHRDLAARNVLVSSSMDCKVADFGLSRQTQSADGNGEGDYYTSQAGVFPIRWTAPEAMETHKFTSKSDVWSFAIVVVEIFQNGVVPYKYTKLDNQSVMNQVLRGTLQHERPAELPPKIYGMIKRCLSSDSAQRPGFVEIKGFLQAQGVTSGWAPFGESDESVAETHFGEVPLGPGGHLEVENNDSWDPFYLGPTTQGSPQGLAPAPSGEDPDGHQYCDVMPTTRGNLQGLAPAPSGEDAEGYQILNHRDTGAGKTEGKIGDVARCDECHSKLAVCVCEMDL